MSKLYHGHAVPVFYEKFSAAIQFFGLYLAESASIRHAGNRGEEREFSLGRFLSELLPSDFRVTSGEAVDLLDNTSPALDIMIYDRSKNSPFYSQVREVIPAEALLASFEVKSTLNLNEIRKSLTAGAKLKNLKPLKRALASVSSNSTHQRGYRYYHGIFAYKSNLTEENWARKELNRLKNELSPGDSSGIDFIYVVGRGLINVANSTFIAENNDTGQALIALYFGIYNFLMRENRRRDPAPFFSYATNLNQFWQAI